jgi:hypothetical protein
MERVRLRPRPGRGERSSLTSRGSLAEALAAMPIAQRDRILDALSEEDAASARE